MNEKYKKQLAYRYRLMLEGKCPKCATPCEPYAYCQKHLLQMRIRNHLRRGAKLGVYRVVSPGRYKLGEVDPRTATIGSRPMFHAVNGGSTRPRRKKLSKSEIAKKLAELIAPTPAKGSE